MKVSGKLKITLVEALVFTYVSKNKVKYIYLLSEYLCGPLLLPDVLKVFKIGANSYYFKTPMAQSSTQTEMYLYLALPLKGFGPFKLVSTYTVLTTY